MIPIQDAVITPATVDDAVAILAIQKRAFAEEARLCIMQNNVRLYLKNGYRVVEMQRHTDTIELAFMRKTR